MAESPISLACTKSSSGLIVPSLKRVWQCKSARNIPDLHLELNPCLLLYSSLDLCSKRQNILRGSSSFINDEIGMQSRNLSTTDPFAFESALLNQGAGRMRGWIAEDATGRFIAVGLCACAVVDNL